MEVECKFCDISRGKSPVKEVFSDEDSMAFLDAKPVFDGHCLLIPKKHFETVMDTPDEVMAHLSKRIKLLAGAVKTALGCDGILVLSNNGVSQSVPHLHIHIVPRKKGDGLKGFMWPRHQYQSDEKAEEIRVKIKKEVDKLIISRKESHA